MSRSEHLKRLEAPVMLDYGVYLKCDDLLSCQKRFDDLSTPDELQFQIVHQVEELWMKLIGFTLVDVIGHVEARRIGRVLTLMERANRLLRLMTQQLDVLETMSPKDYQTIRLQLGNGSGQESPGFRTILRIPPDLWEAYKATFLDADGRTVEHVYNSGYAHDDAYMVAEALIEFDELFQKFRANHLYLIQRSIGLGAKSLKGRPVELLTSGIRHRFFPELWDVRCEMTDSWGGEYGAVREPISSK